MAQILQFKKKTKMRQFFETEESYQEYLEAEKKLRKEPLGPLLTLKDLWNIMVS